MLRRFFISLPHTLPENLSSRFPTKSVEGSPSSRHAGSRKQALFEGVNWSVPSSSIVRASRGSLPALLEACAMAGRLPRIMCLTHAAFST